MQKYWIQFVLLLLVSSLSVTAEERAYFDYENNKNETDPKSNVFLASEEMIVQINLNVTELENIVLEIRYVHEYNMQILQEINDTGYHEFLASTKEVVIHYLVADTLESVIAKGYFDVTVLGLATAIQEGTIFSDGDITVSANSDLVSPQLNLFPVAFILLIWRRNRSNHKN